MATRREAGVGDHSRSSSADLSSPPQSSPASPSAQVANEASTHRAASITVNPSPSGPGAGAGAGVDSGVPLAPPVKERKKPGRKPKISLENGSSSPRKVKDPNAPPGRKRKSQNQTATPESSTAAAQLKAIAGPERLPTPTPRNAESRPATRDASFEVRPDANLTRPASQNGKHEDIPTQKPIHSFFNAPPPPPPQQQQQSAPSQPQHSPLPLQQQPVRTSGQNYDPIRSINDPVRETVVSHHSYSNSQGSPNHPPPTMNRASASPSISSLVDPPNQAMTSPSIATQSFFHQQQQARYRDDNRPSVPPSPTFNRLAPSAIIETGPKPSTQYAPSPALQSTASSLPSVPPQPKTSMVNENGNSKKTNGSANTSAAASPKPFSKAKDKDIFPAPPPLPGAMGAGLNDGTEFRAPTVFLNIPLQGETNKYINFTRLAEDRYGWDALHPRLAAQRDRLARVAAAGAALERNGSNRESGDEMSVSGDEDSNVEMGGMSDGRTGTDGGVKKVVRKRKMKEDEYDKDDGFVDDTELLWEEQAAAANDGFFVYSGPLVPEVPKPVELRADGAPKRGRGRGSRGGALSRVSGRGGGPGSRGGLGPGSRGGSTTRKPRITKADRARMEQEKIEREKMGTMTSMPGNYGGGMPQLAANLGNTPMVFNQ
ncbi:Histone promoter control 2 [Hyphodiscus hymeniophilus]|uniref:Histone promoter control 2 n=1 Tax=Hyphodiscus hymeniophilus TaxID=353542 RepID=A0A9P7AUY3_9HELO|nr:Histone promoter control 2 [Hyphodiscus hymeniophilus]